MPAHEINHRGGVRVDEPTAGHHAIVRTGLVSLVGEVTVEDVVARVAPVVVDVGPCLAELVARIAGFRCTSLDRQRLQQLVGELSAGRGSELDGSDDSAIRIVRTTDAQPTPHRSREFRIADGQHERDRDKTRQYSIECIE